MNRQARVVMRSQVDGEVIPMGEWVSYGNVEFFTAVRKHALKQASPMPGSVVLAIEVRDSEDNSIPSEVFRIEVYRETRILDPRGKTDEIAATTLSEVWKKIKEAMPWRMNPI